MTHDSHEDLLRPTLSAEQDATGFTEPWSPVRPLFITFFFGFIAGSILYWQNYRRLGKEGDQALVIALALVYAVLASSAAVSYAHVSRIPEPTIAQLEELRASEQTRGLNEPDEELSDRYKTAQLKARKRNFRLGRRLLALLLAGIHVVRQRPRFRIAAGHDIPQGRLLGPAVVAIIAGVVAEGLFLSIALGFAILVGAVVL